MTRVLNVVDWTMSIVVVQSLSRVGSLWPQDCSTPGSSVLYSLTGFAQIHVHWLGDTIQPFPPPQKTGVHSEPQNATLGSRAFADVIKVKTEIEVTLDLGGPWTEWTCPSKRTSRGAETRVIHLQAQDKGRTPRTWTLRGSEEAAVHPGAGWGSMALQTSSTIQDNKFLLF